jgi:hypothetical protein
MFSMKNNLKYINYILLILISLMFYSCTDFGTSGDKIDSKSKSKINGKINLEGSNSPGGVNIYLDGFDEYTVSDSDGNFSIEIEPARSQPGGGITGAFQLYFYMDNYELKIIDIPVKRGEFVYGQGPISGKGKLSSDVNMHKILDIMTSTTPTKINNSYSGLIDISVILTNLVDTVWVYTNANKDNNFSSAFLRDLISVENVQMLQTEGNLRVVPVSQTQQWHMIIDWNYVSVNPGNYEVIPYIKVKHENMPQGLKNILGLGSDFFTSDFLNIPNTYQTSLISINNSTN